MPEPLVSPTTAPDGEQAAARIEGVGTLAPSDVANGPLYTSHSVFTKAEKWCIVSMVASAAWFSTLSSFIYFPALALLAKNFGVSIDQINLTITAYMIVATVAPTLVGDTADVIGRRPVYIVVLTIYVVANIALANTQTYAQLLGLRLLQALGSSGVIAIGYGVISDVASPSERGSFVNVVSFAITIAPSLGPVLGGALAYAAGWPWIFAFLAIAAGATLLTIMLFLPETCRHIVGDGSIPPPKYLRLPVPTVMRHWSDEDLIIIPHAQVPNPLKSIKILLRKDNAAVITACGLMYVVYTSITASLSTLFIRIYGLNELQAGLIYLPFGLGGMASTLFSGRMLDWAYRRARLARGVSTERGIWVDLDNFPVEKARLDVMWIPMALTSVSTVAFGWVLHFEQHIAVPLAIQFIVGMTLQADFTIYNTLLVDINHKSPSAAHASSNLVRCTLAAVMIAVLQQLIDAAGIGWAFTFMGGLCVVCLGLFALDYWKGFSWRQKSVGI